MVFMSSAPPGSASAYAASTACSLSANSSSRDSLKDLSGSSRKPLSPKMGRFLETLRAPSWSSSTCVICQPSSMMSVRGVMPPACRLRRPACTPCKTRRGNVSAFRKLESKQTYQPGFAPVQTDSSFALRTDGLLWASLAQHACMGRGLGGRTSALTVL